MTAITYVGAIAGVALIVAGAAVLIHLARDYAEDRRREETYADEWSKSHRKYQEDRDVA